jgi:hypothetical protein
MNSIGSIWRKWDLHIHTPASFHWSGKRLQQQSDGNSKLAGFSSDCCDANLHRCATGSIA